MQLHSIFLNGPPGVGKDTFGLLVCAAIRQAIYDHKLATTNVSIHKFAAPLKNAIAELMQLPELPDSQEYKNTPQNDFFGNTPREALIALSEGFAKPMFGKDVFGYLAVRAIHNRTSKNTEHQIAIFTDSGFVEETSLVARLSNEAVLLRLHREGVSFESDSRSYIRDLAQNCHEHDLRLPPIEELGPLAERVARAFLNFVHPRVKFLTE